MTSTGSVFAPKAWAVAKAQLLNSNSNIFIVSNVSPGSIAVEPLLLASSSVICLPIISGGDLASKYLLGTIITREELYTTITQAVPEYSAITNEVVYSTIPRYLSEYTITSSANEQVFTTGKPDTIIAM